MMLRVPPSLALAVLPALSLAQTSTPAPAAPSYEARYAEVLALAPRADRVAQVTNLVLKRDVAQFTLANGTIYLLSSVGGRTMGAVFQGEGSFSFSPPTRIEQDRLARFEKVRSLDARVTELVLLFADSTLAELEGKVKFGQGQVPGEIRTVVKKSLEYLGDEDSKSFHPDMMTAFLNQESNDLFYAHITRDGGGPLMFMLDPFESEEVILENRAPRRFWTHQPEVICRFARQRAAPDSATGERRGTPTIRAYRLDNTLTQTGSGDLTFAAAARLEIATPVASGPWVPFELFYKLQIDSARWEGGEPATVFRGKEAMLLWVKLDRRLEAGETRSLLLYYHGDLIDRYGDFFFIKSPSSWYPVSLDERSYATFDITYHTPSQYLIASVGERADSGLAGHVLTTRWVTPGPIRNASFNLGQFEDYKVKEDGVPPVTIMVSEQAHRELAKGLRERGYVLMQQRKMKETVGADVTQSLKFFQHVYGAAPVKQVYATEIPYYEGLAFPGMVDLSWVTFQQTDQQGEDEVFRSHEVAHQWWGIGVDFATYHDQWMSEGFADFSGLWYLQAARKDNEKYFGVLRRWRANIFLHKDEPSPIWLGYRISSSKDEVGYQILVYQKGAWVLHMLRILMLDLKTMNEDRFTATMQDFYRTYNGRRASTEDFQRIVEQHAGFSMDWFFQEWVYGTAIPTYRVAYKTEPAGNGQYRVKLRVAQEGVPDDFRTYVPVALDLGSNRVARVRVNVTGPSSEIDLPLLPAEPKALKFNDLDGVLCDVKMVGW